MLYYHRIFGLFAAVLILFVSATGMLVEGVDIRALLMKLPASHPDVQALHEHYYGPVNYQVATPPDFSAPALPPGLDYQAEFAKVASLARAKAASGAALQYIELRMAGGAPAGDVEIGNHRMIFSLASKKRLPDSDLPPGIDQLNPPSLRENLKEIHKFGFLLGEWGVIFDAMAGVGLCVLIFTGMWQYVKVIKGRNSLGKKALFWVSGGWWRTLHRWFAVITIPFVSIFAVTGLALCIDCISMGIHFHFDQADHVSSAMAHRGDYSLPLQDDEIASMLKTTLDSFAAMKTGEPIRVLRLRYFAGMPQGVLVLGDPYTTQLAFNTRTGRTALLTEAGYPDTGFIFGWQWHQWLKSTHRGDIIKAIGMPGRFIMFLSAAAMAYFAISGVKIYYDLWAKRKRTGRKAVIWH